MLKNTVFSDVIASDERNLQGFVDQLQTYVARLAPDGTITVINRAFLKMAATHPEGAIGRKIWDLAVWDIAPEIKKVLEVNILKAAEGAATHFEVVLDKCSDRTVMDVVLSPVPGKENTVESITLEMRDVTAQKRLEETLRANDERFQTLYLYNPSMCFTMDTQGRIVSINLFGASQLGYEVGELEGRSMLSIFCPEDHGTVMERFETCLQSPWKIFHWEFRKVRKDGSLIWALDYARAVVGEDGTVSVMMVCEDITEHKHAEEALCQSQQRLAGIINHLPDATFAIDRSGRIIAWNVAMEELLGVSSREMVGRGDYEYAIPFYGERKPILIDYIFKPDEEIRKGFYTNIRRLGNAVTAETTLVRPGSNSAILWCKATALFDQNGAQIGAIESIRDITDLQHAEAVLRESEARLNTIVNGSPMPMFVIGTDHRVMYWNKSLEEYSGIKASEVVGTNRHWTIFYDSERPCLADLLLDDAIEKAPMQGTEYIIKSPLLEGAYKIENFYSRNGKWLRGIAITIRDENHRITGVVEMFEDVTEPKLIEEQIKASLTEKEVLLKEIHHRVKNNLQVISSLLSLQSGSLRDMQDLKMFKESQNRIRSMALIHEKLYSSKDLSRVDFADYIRSLAGSLVKSYSADAGRITLDLQIDRVFLGIDAAIPCGLILNELITNSLKYAFPGGREGRITVSMHASDDGLVKMTVSDDGIGLPEDFDLSKATTLGLQIVSTLVDQLEGSIEITRDHGTIYVITFRERQAKSKAHRP